MNRKKLLGSFLMIFVLGVLQAGAEETGSFERSLKISGAVDMEVTSGAGNITVHNGSDNEVHVVAKIHAGSSWLGGASAAEKIKRIQNNPPVEQQGNTIRIGRIEDRDLQQNVSIDYDITAPAQTKLTSHTGSGDQTIRGLQLPLSAKTGSGGIVIENVGAETRVAAGSGDLKISSVKGALSATTGSGSIHASGISGDVSASTGSGDVEVEQVAAGNTRVETGSGHVKVRGNKGGLHIETGSGDIHAEGEPTADWRIGTGSGEIGLKVPSQASFTLDAKTSSGRLTVHHPVTTQGSISKNHIQGKVGNGGALIDVHTASGDIAID
jgi:Putative adhesin